MSLELEAPGVAVAGAKVVAGAKRDGSMGVLEVDAPGVRLVDDEAPVDDGEGADEEEEGPSRMLEVGRLVVVARGVPSSAFDSSSADHPAGGGMGRNMFSIVPVVVVIVVVEPEGVATLKSKFGLSVSGFLEPSRLDGAFNRRIGLARGGSTVSLVPVSIAYDEGSWYADPSVELDSIRPILGVELPVARSETYGVCWLVWTPEPPDEVAKLDRFTAASKSASSKPRTRLASSRV